MKAIIPVAGVGERLRPFTHTKPKPLLPVSGKPILFHIMDDIISAGIRDFVLVVGHLGSQIEEEVKNRYKNEIQVDFVNQKQLLGLGYAIFLALEIMKKDEPALIILGDTIVQVDLEKILGSDSNILGLKQVDDPRRFGVANLDGDKVIAVEEKPDKPKSNWAVTGVYYIKDTQILSNELRHLLDNKIFNRGEMQLTDALAKMIENNISFGHIQIENWFDCGTTKALLDTNRVLLDQHHNETNADNTVIIPPVYIDKTATVKNSIIGPYVSIGENVDVVHSIISDSIIGNNSSVEDSFITRSIIGNSACLQGSATEVNLGDWSLVKEKQNK